MGWIESSRGPHGRTADHSEGVIEYDGIGYATFNDAYAGLILIGASTFMNFDGRTLLAAEFEVQPMTDAGDTNWTGRIVYRDLTLPTIQREGQVSNDTTFPWKVSFDLSTHMGHVERSLEVVNTYTRGTGPSDPPPDHDGAMGVTIGQDGRTQIAGADVLLGDFRFTVSGIVLLTTLTPGYVKSLRDLVAPRPTTNQDIFREFDPGEVLLIGISGAQRSSVDAEISFTFAAAKAFDPFMPDTGLLRWDPTVPTAVAGSNMAKNGWEHIDFTFEDQATNGRTRPRIRYAHRHRNYDPGDWDATFPLGVNA